MKSLCCLQSGASGGVETSRKTLCVHELRSFPNLVPELPLLPPTTTSTVLVAMSGRMKPTDKQQITPRCFATLTVVPP